MGVYQESTDGVVPTLSWKITKGLMQTRRPRLHSYAERFGSRTAGRLAMGCHDCRQVLGQENGRYEPYGHGALR